VASARVPAKLRRELFRPENRSGGHGSAFGTIVLHVAPESAIGGPLAIVQTGDRITLDVKARRLDLLIDDTEFNTGVAARQAANASRTSSPHRSIPTRGYARLFEDHILQADEGCDCDFLLRSTRMT
jgi:dihydroxy-acid dehydratase